MVVVVVVLVVVVVMVWRFVGKGNALSTGL